MGGEKKALIVTSVATMISQFNMGNIDVLQKGGYKVYVVCNFEKYNPCSDEEIKKLKNALKSKGVEIYQVDFSRDIKNIKYHFRAYSQLKKIANKKFDIVHCQSPIGGVLTRLAFKRSRKNGARVIYTAHGFHFYKGAPAHYWLMFYPVEKWLAKYTDTLITINAEDYERAKKKFGKRCHDIQYVPGVGVDEKKFEKKMSATGKTKLRESLGLKNDDKVLICVGRLDKNKNQGFLIKAMPGLLKKSANYHLLLVGPDEINGKYQKLADKLNVSGNVHFLGFRDDVDKLLQISDVMVSASKREGLPVNLIEAAFLNMPIVAMDCRGGRDVCEVVGSRTIKQGDYKNYIKQITNIKSSNYNDEVEQYNADNVMGKMSRIYFRKKRILHVLATGGFSGAENVVCMLIENLSDRYDMLYCSPFGEIKNILRRREIKYFGVKKINSKCLKEVINEFDPDIIHAHDYTASVKVALSGFDKKIISHLHDNMPFARYWNIKTILYAICARKFSVILGVSDAVLNEAVFKKIIYRKYITVYNYVNANKVIELANEYKFPKKYDLCFIGRLSAQKNPIEFIRIVGAVKEDDSHVSACMIGDGDLAAQCKTMISNTKLEKNVELLGFLENPFPVISNCKVCVMPSKWEGFGLSAIESLILNKPVYNSGAGGLSEIFKGGGYLMVCHNINEYVSKIRNYKNVSGKVFSEIYSRYTDENLWRNRIISIYEMPSGDF